MSNVFADGLTGFFHKENLLNNYERNDHLKAQVYRNRFHFLTKFSDAVVQFSAVYPKLYGVVSLDLFSQEWVSGCHTNQI